MKVSREEILHIANLAQLRIKRRRDRHIYITFTRYIKFCKYSK